jgi:hypothetical protein
MFLVASHELGPRDRSTGAPASMTLVSLIWPAESPRKSRCGPLGVPGSECPANSLQSLFGGLAGLVGARSAGSILRVAAGI